MYSASLFLCMRFVVCPDIMQVRLLLGKFWIFSSIHLEVDGLSNNKRSCKRRPENEGIYNQASILRARIGMSWSTAIHNI